jgi:hypothetical protein
VELVQDCVGGIEPSGSATRVSVTLLRQILTQIVRLQCVERERERERERNCMTCFINGIMDS